MSTPYNLYSSTMIKWIESQIRLKSYTMTKMLTFFNAHAGLVETVPEGMMQVQTTQWEKMAPGAVSASLQKLPLNQPNLSDVTTNLLMLATKITIPMLAADRYNNNNLVGAGDLVSQAVNLYMRSLTNQVDQFLAWGDKMKDTLTYLDKAVNIGDFTGMFNIFTTLNGGAGADNDTKAAGDYIATVVSYNTAMKNSSYEGVLVPTDPNPKYFYFTTPTISGAAEQGNNLYTTYSPVTELSIVKARQDVVDWIDSPNFVNADGNHLILGMTPYTSENEPTIRLLQGYNMKIVPLFSGGLSGEANFEIIVIWSGALQSLHPEAGRNSGTLVYV